jgi:hypothetical protein
MKLITDYAHPIETNKDTATYQHASTFQLFRTVRQSDGNVELLIFDCDFGSWQTEGIMTPDRVVEMVANPD